MMMIKMLTAALMVMPKTVINRIAKTLITLITTSFIISIRLSSIVINERWMSCSCNSTSQFISIMFCCSFFSLFFTKELTFSSVGEPLHVHGHIFAWPSPFFMTPPFSESQKVVTLPLFPPPPPLISDKSLKANVWWYQKYYCIYIWLQCLWYHLLYFLPTSF